MQLSALLISTRDQHPHFLMLDMSGEQAFPEEVFWARVRSLVVLKRHGSYRR